MKPLTLVYKYSLRSAMSDGIPEHVARILHVGDDPNGVPSVWAEVEPHKTHNKPYRVTVIGTGEEVPEGLTHLGSLLNSPFVWHVYGDEL